jgi:cytochrome c biogenesis protein CcmG, thiol:disulfide interchange protein DsbE
LESLTGRLPLVVLVAALSACNGNDAPALPALVLPALAGFPQDVTELDTGELDGPAVLNLWATWCVPCRTELPEFQRASAEHPNIRFVGIDEGFEPAESVAFLDDLGVTYDQFVDTDGTFAEELEVTELPSTVVVGADGDVLLHHTGALSYDDLVAALATTSG